MPKINPAVHKTIKTAFQSKEFVAALKKRVQFLLDVFFVIDNCANVHLINDITLFESKLLDYCSQYGEVSLEPKK